MSPSAEGQEPRSTEAGTDTISRWTLLLVEDDPEAASRLETMLRHETAAALELHQCGNLETTLTRLALGGIHLVLLDLSLPDSVGLGTFRQVKAFFPDVPVIVLSDQDNEVWAREATKAGAQDFLAKDRLDTYWLRRTVRHALERHAAEEKLRTTRALYYSLVEHLPHGIFRKDPQGRFTFVNQRFCQMAGRTADQVLGRTAADLFPPELAEKYRAQDLEVVRTGEPFDGVEEFQGAEGQRAYLHIVKTPITDRKGRPVGVQGLLLDITERRKAEEAVRSSQQLLQSIIDNTAAVIYVKDSAGRYLLVNSGFEALFRVVRGRAVGRTDYELFPREVAEACWPNDRKVLEARAPQEFEELITLPEGTRTYISIKFPLTGPDGEPYAVCGISTDITEREQAKRALEESEERLGLVIQGSSDGVWDWNVTTNAVYFSPRWKSMLGYAEDEIENNFAAWERLLHPADRDRALATVRSYFEGRTATYELEHRLRHKDGSYRWILARGVALRDATGRPLRMAGSHVDLTDRKRTEERLRAFAARLEQSNRDLLDFAFVASHDLQEPLGQVKDFVERLQNEAGAGLSEEGRGHLRELAAATARMQDLIHGLLSYSRVHTQAQPFRPVDLDALAREVLAEVEPRLQAMGARVETGPLGRIEADPTQMRQLFYHLVSNALKFARPGLAPVITLRAEHFEASTDDAGVTQRIPWCELTVQDNGLGMDELHLNRMLGSFQRRNRPLEHPGSGFSLATCRRIVERHSGSITARSRPGEGTAFIVRLPVRQTQADAAL